MHSMTFYYKLVKSKLGAQYDPKIGMFRSNCLKVYGMSISYQVLKKLYLRQLQNYHTLLDNIFCGFMDILEYIFNCNMVGV